MHGVWSDRRVMLRRARMLRSHGIASLLFDFQAAGECPGRRITYGYLEGQDAAAAVAYTRARLPGERVAAIGISLGGAAALLGPGPLPVDALILESVYPDIDAALGNRLRAALGPVAGAILVPVLTPLFKLILPPILGVLPRDLRPIDRIAHVTAPLLVLAGTLDDRTPMDESRALFARAPEPKQFLPVPGAAHVDLEAFDAAAYWRAVLPFLEAHLRR